MALDLSHSSKSLNVLSSSHILFNNKNSSWNFSRGPKQKGNRICWTDPSAQSTIRRAGVQRIAGFSGLRSSLSLKFHLSAFPAAILSPSMCSTEQRGHRLIARSRARTLREARARICSRSLSRRPPVGWTAASSFLSHIMACSHLQNLSRLSSQFNAFRLEHTHS